MKTHQYWTETDREQLKQLAAEHCSDYTIAKIMGRTASAVSWQRRKLRIKLGRIDPTKNGCASWMENANYPTLFRKRYKHAAIKPKPPMSAPAIERPEYVDRMMRLAFGGRL